MNKRLWLTWETQRRNAELADAFGCQYGHFDFSSAPAPLRYLKSILATLRVFYSRQFFGGKQTRNEVVFAQCPSVVLVALLAMLRCVHRFVFVIDAHNITFEYLASDTFLLRALARFSLKRADYIIVSNLFLARDFPEFERKFLSLPDKLPQLNAGSEELLPELVSSCERPWFLLIATFAPDEPIDFFLESISSLAAGRGTVFVSGKRSRAGNALRHESEHIRFTDFLPHDSFDALVSRCDLVIDLSTRENCLVCGAYEAIAAEVPALLSDSPATRDVFPSGCLYAENTAESYRSALQDYFDSADALGNDARKMRSMFQQRWNSDFDSVCTTLGITTNTG